MNNENTTPQAEQEAPKEVSFLTLGLYWRTQKWVNYTDWDWKQVYVRIFEWGDQKYQILVNEKCTQVAVKNLGSSDVHLAKIKIWTFTDWSPKRTASVGWMMIFINDTSKEFYKAEQLNRYYVKIQNATSNADPKAIKFEAEEEEIKEEDTPDF